MSSIIINTNNYKYPFLEKDYDEDYKFKASDLDWLTMCKSESMDTMEFLSENRPWIIWYTIIKNGSDATWWLIQLVLEDVENGKDKTDNTKEIWSLMSSMETEMAKDLCELYAKYIVWDKISNNKADWAVELLIKNQEKMNKEIFYQCHVQCHVFGGLLNIPVNVKEILNKYTEEFDLIEKNIQEKETRELGERLSREQNKINWSLVLCMLCIVCLYLYVMCRIIFNL